MLRKGFAQMDADRSGFVDLLELKSLVEDASHNVEHVGHYKWASPKALQDLDANGDGRIGIDEWVSHVLVLEEETSDGDFAAAVDEWMKAVNTSRRTTLLRLVFSKMDADQSGVVEMSEFVHRRGGRVR